MMKTMLVVEQNVSKQFATKRFSTSGKQINLRNRQLVAIVKFKSVNYLKLVSVSVLCSRTDAWLG